MQYLYEYQRSHSIEKRLINTQFTIVKLKKGWLISVKTDSVIMIIIINRLNLRLLVGKQSNYFSGE